MKYGKLSLLFLLLATAACKPQPDIPVPDQGRADFSQMAVLGGHLMAGYQDGALYAEGQNKSIPALIHHQLRHFNTDVFRTALISDTEGLGINFKPWQSLFQTRSRMNSRVDCKGEESMGPVKDTFGLSAAANLLAVENGEFQFLAIPGAGLWDWDDPAVGLDLQSGGNVYYHRMAQQPGTSTMLSDVIAQDPSFLIMWPGMQDMYNWATAGGYGVPDIDPAAFRAKLDSTLGALTAKGAKGVLATIPDVMQMPFFNLIPPRGLPLSQGKADSLNDIYALGGANPGFTASETNGFMAADANSPDGFRQMKSDESIMITAPLDSMRCYLMGVLLNLIPDRYSLIDSEIAELRADVAGMNAAIRDLAIKYDFAVADMESYYTTMEAGIVFDAVDFSTEFGAGGFFSLDGIGLTPKGAGLAANEFITAINAHYGSSIPTVRIDDLRGVLFP